MEYEYNYNGLEERQSEVASAEGFGLRMISDHFDPDWKKGEEPRGTMVFTNEPSPPIVIEPIRSTHFARVTGFNPSNLRPLEVARTYQGQEFNHDCFVTQDIVDAYTTGKLQIGDYVLVHFDDNGEQVAMMKIYKTW